MKQNTHLPLIGTCTEIKKLGRKDLDISQISLGTMTWGFQNMQAEGFKQMNYALERNQKGRSD